MKISNAIPREVQVDRIYWVTDSGDIAEPVVTTQDFPLLLRARGLEARRETIAIPYAVKGDQVGGQRLMAELRLPGRSWSQTLPVAAGEPVLDELPIPSAGIAAQLEQHEFLQVDGQIVSVSPGSWEVSDWLLIPDGYELHIPAGTRLRFGYEAGLISHGALRFSGTRAEPVVLEANTDDPDGTWPGLVVLDASNRSSWGFVEVYNTRGIALNGWQLTGGVNFYQSDVEIKDSRLIKSFGEDALNIISSEFFLENLSIATTVSDAFDADFSNGSVSQSQFRDIGLAGGGRRN